MTKYLLAIGLCLATVCIAGSVAPVSVVGSAFRRTSVLIAAEPDPASGVRLVVPGATNEHVSLAASGRTVAAAWAATPEGGRTDIYAAISSDEGQTFGRPVRVGSDASVNAEQPPRVAIAPLRSGQTSPDLVVVWTAKAAGGTRLISARSHDGGRTFSAATVVPGSAASGNRGWQSLAIDAMGHPIVIWLDHREGATAAGAGHQHHGEAASTATAAEASVARAGTSRLYVGSIDGSVPVQALVHGVCYCCKTALAVSPGGDLVTAWRHVYAGGFRDIAFSRSGDGGRTFSTPARVNQDGWQIAGCPEDGPAIAVDATGRSHVVWPTLVRENGRETMAVFHASTEDGRTFSARTRVPAGDAAFHPQIAVAPSGDLLVAWDEGSSGTRRVRLVRGTVSKTRPGLEFSEIPKNQTRSGFSEPGSHPAVVATSAGAVVAWTSRVNSGSEIRVARYP